MTDFLQIKDKTFVVFGAANRKSVAWAIGCTLQDAGARVIHVVRDVERRAEVTALLAKRNAGGAPAPLVCNVEHQGEIDAVAAEIAKHGPIDGLVHSLAFANYSEGFKPFHETKREDFLQAVNISAFSLVAIANALKPHFAQGASAITIGISTTRMAAENYGYMAPIKAALHSSVVFLAKSFAGAVRFNAVCPGLLKTSASAGIPGYLDSYLYAEKATLRKQGVATEEVANAAVFLLSPASSGINAQEIVIDAGMGVNYFDKTIIERMS
ncbi:MAG: SDR family oxidoreductase [Planctomycetes bacterium]|nr:SDR family oxidoreductase [Planctomycetota bacterium]